MEQTITERLEATIEHVPAVVLLGARQAGKTPLAKAIGRTCRSIYLDSARERHTRADLPEII